MDWWLPRKTRETVVILFRHKVMSNFKFLNSDAILLLPKYFHYNLMFKLMLKPFEISWPVNIYFIAYCVRPLQFMLCRSYKKDKINIDFNIYVISPNHKYNLNIFQHLYCFLWKDFFSKRKKWSKINWYKSMQNISGFKK